MSSRHGSRSNPPIPALWLRTPAARSRPATVRSGCSMRPDNVVSRVDPKTSTVTAMIPVGEAPDGIATSPGAVWVANHGPPASGPTVSASIRRRIRWWRRSRSAAPAVLLRSTWERSRAPDPSGSPSRTGAPSRRFDASTNAVTATISSRERADQPCGGVAVSDAAVWVARCSLRQRHQADRSAHEPADRSPGHRQRLADQRRSRLRLALGSDLDASRSRASIPAHAGSSASCRSTGFPSS